MLCDDLEEWDDEGGREAPKRGEMRVYTWLTFLDDE